MAEIYVPNIAGTVTLADLRSRVNKKLRNFSYWVSYHDSGNGENVDFVMPVGNMVENSLTVTCTTAQTPPTIDLESGWIILSNAPEEDEDILFRYRAKVWDDDDIDEAINGAVRYLYSRFVLEDTDESITTTTEYEYALPDDMAYVKRVEYKASGGTSYTTQKQNGWEVFRSGGTRYLRLYGALSADGTLRLVGFPRPGPLVKDTDTLEASAHLDGMAQDPVVYYACWAVLHDVVSQKASSNAFLNAEGPNALRMIDVLRAADEFLKTCEMHAERLRSTPHFNRF